MGNVRWLRLTAIAGAVLAMAALGGMLVWAPDFATQEPDHLHRRLMADRGPMLGPAAAAEPPWYPPAPGACHERARAALRRALEQTHPVRAAEALEHALVLDPDCPAAMRLAVQAAAHAGRLPALFARLVTRAEREPLNAAAQLGAAMWSDYAGRSGDMLAFLQKAEALRPDLPLMAATWANHHRFHGDPPDWARILPLWHEEQRRHQDPATLAARIAFYTEVPDRLATLEDCRAFYEAAPGYRGAHPARSCLGSAVQLGDVQAVADYRARLAAAGESAACQERWITYFGLLAGHPEARTRAASGSGACTQLFPWLRGVALLEQGHTAVAAASLAEIQTTPAWIAAAAMALAGRREDAVAKLRATRAPAGSRTQLLRGLLEQDLLPPATLQALFRQPRAETAAAHQAEAACGYLAAGLRDAGRLVLARAASAAPADPFVVTCQLRWFTSQGELGAAEEVAQRARTLGLSEGAVLAEMGHLRVQQDRCAEALPLLERAFEQAPLHPGVVPNRVRCLRRLGRADEAERWSSAHEPPEPGRKWLLAVVVVVALAALGVALARRPRAA